MQQMGTGEWIALGSFLVFALVSAAAGLLYIIRAEQSKAALHVKEMSEKAAEIHSELIPNHGSSLRDAVDRIESAVFELKAHDELHSRLMEEHVGTLRRYGNFIADLNKDFRHHLQAHINKE